MKIAYAQMKITPGHPDINTKKILQLIEEAKAGGADVVIFPAYAIQGELLGNTWDQRSFRNDCERCEREIIAASKGIAVIFECMDESLAKDFIIALDEEIIDDEAADFSYKVKYGTDGKNCFGGADFYIKYHIGIKTAYGCPMIRVLGVGICNNGKKIFVHDGGSAVFNSKGEVVQYAEPFTECLNFIELDEIDKMSALEVPEVSEAEKIIGR